MLLKREDCKRTKHDSAFSQWKVLIGPSDWEDHSLGKEGAERYRVHNLPNCSSCSGLYELGIAVPHARAGRETRKLKSYSVIPVYLGQAENVRTRLQRYGREGAHLGNCKSTGGLNDSAQQGPGLFLEIFTRGCSVVYRWAPMKNKKDAVETETQLLGTFDYAWNKGSNGVRRPNDILQKLDRRTLRKTLFPVIARKLRTFHQKKMGIKIESCRSFLLEDGSSTYSDWENIGLLSRILKFGRSQPRPVSQTYGCNEDNASICGVALGRGSVCRMLPIEGRRRCAEHKGMKVNGFTSMLIKEGKSLTEDVTVVESHVSTDPECESYQAPSIRCDKVKPQLVPNHCAVGKYTFSICGVTMHDGTSCRRQPIQGRKRCAEHKGRKITGTIVESLAETNHNCLHGPHFGSATCADGYELVSQEHGKCEGLQTPVFLERSVMHKLDTTCGVNLTDGTSCRRRPVVGRKRCKEHKGLRVNGSKPKLPVENLLGLFEGSGICSPVRGVLDGSFIDSSGL